MSFEESDPFIDEDEEREPCEGCFGSGEYFEGDVHVGECPECGGTGY